MTKKDLFIVLIKIFGLYSLITALFSTLPSNIIFVIQNIDFIGIIWILFSSLIIVGLFYLLITKSEKIATILKLESGFDEPRIDFGNLKSVDIIKLAVLIIGGFLFIENVPTFLTNTLFAFKSSIPKGFDSAFQNNGVLKYNRIEDYTYWITSGTNLLIGYLLVSNYKRVSDFLNNKLN
jgi:hypothetical protein